MGQLLRFEILLLLKRLFSSILKMAPLVPPLSNSLATAVWALLRSALLGLAAQINLKTLFHSQPSEVLYFTIFFRIRSKSLEL